MPQIVPGNILVHTVQPYSESLITLFGNIKLFIIYVCLLECS